MRQGTRLSGKSLERLAWLLVSLVGGLLGYFVWQTYLAVSQTYLLDLSTGKTLIAEPSSSRAFFRKTLYLPDKVRHAWLAIAGSETFTLQVNGRIIGRMKTLEPVARDIYDLTTALEPGKNVVAVEVVRFTFPEPAWVRLAGGYTTWEGRSHVICSDLTWRANIREGNILRVGKPLRWYEVDYDDVRWPRARPYPEETVLIYPPLVKNWPLLYATPPQGPWLWDPGGADLEVRLRRSLRFPFPGPHRIWIRLSGLCPYRLALNGETIAVRANAAPTFDILDVSPLIGWGENHFDLAVRRAPGRIGILAEIFVQQASGEIEIYRGDNGWIVPAGPGGKPPKAPALLAPYPSYPGFAMGQQLDQILFPWWYPWWSWATALIMVGGMSLLVWGHWRFWEDFWRRDRDAGQLRWRLAFFHLPAGLFLGIIWLLGFDVRFSPDWPYQNWVILTALAILVGGQILGGFWLRGREDNHVHSL